MKLRELVQEMDAVMDKCDMSDEWLEEHGDATRRIGEFSHGISMVPCLWVFPYLYELATNDKFKDIVEEIERRVESEV